MIQRSDLFDKRLPRGTHLVADIATRASAGGVCQSRQFDDDLGLSSFDLEVGKQSAAQRRCRLATEGPRRHGLVNCLPSSSRQGEIPPKGISYPLHDRRVAISNEYPAMYGSSTGRPLAIVRRNRPLAVDERGKVDQVALIVRDSARGGDGRNATGHTTEPPGQSCVRRVRPKVRAAMLTDEHDAVAGASQRRRFALASSRSASDRAVERLADVDEVGASEKVALAVSADARDGTLTGHQILQRSGVTPRAASTLRRGIFVPQFYHTYQEG